MEKIKELNVVNRTYYHFNDIMNIKDFHSNLLRIDKKNCIKTLIFTILVTLPLKKSIDVKILSVNPLYLMIHSATGYFKEKHGKKYLVLDPTKKYDEVFSEIKKEIETINGGKKLFYEKNHAKIKINTYDGKGISFR